MHLVVERDGGETEIDLRLLHPDATVADLTATLDPSAPAPRGLVVGGHRHGPDEPLADLGLTHGTTVSVSDPDRRTVAATASPTGVCLAVVGGPDAGTIVALPTGASVTVGRANGTDHVLDDRTASGRHARFDVGDDGRVRVTDLGSTNGTFLDGRRVTATVDAPSGSTTPRSGPRSFASWRSPTTTARSAIRRRAAGRSGRCRSTALPGRPWSRRRRPAPCPTRRSSPAGVGPSASAP